MKSSFIYCLCVFATAISGCSSMPLSSLARLYSNPEARIIDSRPADIAVALQVDQRLVLTSRDVPTLKLALKPREMGVFEPVDEALIMIPLSLTPYATGLEAAGNGRKWLVYGLAAQDYDRLARFQARFQQLRKEKKGGSMSIGVKIDGIGQPRPGLENTQIESRLRTSLEEGFLKIWSGTQAELQEMVKREQKKS